MFLARPFGQEAAQAFRRLVDRVVSRNDTLFEYASSSAEAASSIVAFQAWGAWIIYGLTAGLLAMWVARWLARGPVSWLAILIVVIFWAGIYLFIWRWDNELHFALGRASSGMGQTWGPWLHAASFGFFAGFVFGLILAATPWRVEKIEMD